MDQQICSSLFLNMTAVKEKKKHPHVQECSLSHCNKLEAKEFCRKSKKRLLKTQIYLCLVTAWG